MLSVDRQEQIVIRQVRLEGNTVWLDVDGAAGGAPCPSCGVLARKVHDRYQRCPRDVPWRGWPARWAVTVRRFRCPTPTCPRRTFAERFGSALARYARRTAAATAVLGPVARALGGEAGARLAGRLGLPVSPDTLLRVLLRRACPPAPPVRVLGVDDWAWRRGHRYGSILVDLERHRVVELLPDRSADGLAQWLGQHPGVEVAARDRAGAYAEGLRRGAPRAVQVADRWHLVKNAGDALERVLQRHHPAQRAAVAAGPGVASGLDDTAGGTAAAGEPGGEGGAWPATAAPAAGSDLPERPPAPTAAGSSPSRERRLAVYRTVVALREQGLSITRIARQVGRTRVTVRAYLRAGGFPERAPPARLLGPSAAPTAYLWQRWTQGCHTAAVLWRELQAQGFRGSSGTVRRAVAGWREAPRRRTAGRRSPQPARALLPPAGAPSPHRVRWWLLRHAQVTTRGDPLAAEAQAYCVRLLDGSPAIGAALTLTRAFVQLVRARDAGALAPWLVAAKTSASVEFREFALGLERDRAAVEAALRLPWSTSQVEGQITKLKLTKRSMYGRAGLPLLRARLLPAG